MMQREPHLARIEAMFNRNQLRATCVRPEGDFAAMFGLDTYKIEGRDDGDDDLFFFKDNGSDVLAVAHLDTVIEADRRTCSFAETESGLVVHSGALDDRLGAYLILELLPLLGLNHDILLTVGEESGRSTAQFFEPAKDYNWMIEFDRGGTDVVMYQYDDRETRALVRECGAVVGDGIFSDIAYLEHLEVKGFNWGVGYRDYHGPRGHAWLADTFEMVGYYLDFYEANSGEYLPHDKHASRFDWWGRYGRQTLDIDYDDEVAEREAAELAELEESENASLWSGDWSRDRLA